MVSDLGLLLTQDGNTLRGEAHSVPEIWIPGTTVVRTSVLACWADILAGLLVTLVTAPRIPVTLDLDVHLIRQPSGTADIHAVCNVVKAGRSVTVCNVWFTQAGNSSPFASSQLSFMASPNPAHVNEAGFKIQKSARRRLSEPFAERAACTVIGPGVAEVPRTVRGLNASGGINGGLIGLVAEQAAMSLFEQPVVASSLTLRYLRPFSVGPARSTAELHGDLAHVEITDAGRDAGIGALATLRMTVAER